VPIGSFAISDKADLFRLSTLLLTGVVTSLLFEAKQAERRAADALRRESELRTLAMEAAGLAAWNHLPSTDEIQADAAWYRMFGCGVGEEPGYRTALDHIHPEDRPARDAAEERAFTGMEGGRYHAEYRVVLPDGRTRWLESHGRVRFEETGGLRRPVSFIGVSADITARRRSEQALREALTELQAIHAHSPVTLLMVDDKFHVRRASDVALGGESPGALPAMLPGDAIGCLDALRYGSLCGPRCETCAVRKTIQSCIEDGTKHETAEAWLPLSKDDAEQQRCLLISASPMRIGGARALVSVQDITDLREAEREVLRLSQLINLSHDAIVTIDEKRIITGWNAGAREIYGWNEEEARGKPIHELLRTEFPVPRPEVDAILRELGRWAGELKHTRRDGTIITVESRQVVVRDEGGRVQAVLEINRDVTERNRAHREAVEANRRTTSILESISEGFVSFDRHWRYTYVNPAAARMLQKSPLELLGRKREEIWPDSEIAAIYRRAEEECAPIQEEIFSPILNAWVELRCYPSGEGLAVFFRDVTARRQAEAAMRERERNLLRFTEAAPVAIAMLDRDLRYLAASARYRADYGLGSQKLEGRSHYELFPEISEEWRAVHRRCLEGALERSDGERFARNDGSEQWLRWEIQPWRKEDGSIAGIALFSEDITERRRAEEEIRRLNGELEERVRRRTAQLAASNKELEAFAYSVSHDLRAPLRGIDGWSLALLEDYGEQLNEEARGYLIRVRTETQRMGHLIDDLLQLSRLTRSEMKSEPVDLTGLAREVAERLRVLNPDRDVDFAIQSGLTVIGDRSLLEVALTNLLSNSVKFTAKRERARVEFGQTGDGSAGTFYVRDNGVGFNMEYAKMLFGAFQRLHKASEFPGNGIGLATVQRVIRRHGGKVWAEAKPDEGATFYFALTGD